MTNAEARFNKSLRPRKPDGSLGRTAQDGHLDSHTAPEPTMKKLKALKVDVIQDRNIHCLQARPCIVQPGNLTGWGGSEGVKTGDASVNPRHLPPCTCSCSECYALMGRHDSGTGTGQRVQIQAATLGSVLIAAMPLPSTSLTSSSVSPAGL